MTPQMIQSLSDGPLLRQLSPEVRSVMLSKARLRSYDRGMTICLQGERARNLKLVLDGWVKLFRVSESGDEALLTTLQMADSFDEAAAWQGGNCQASAEAVGTCTVLHIDLASLRECQTSKDQVQAAVLTAASHHMDGLMAQVEQLKVQTGTQRLTDYLTGLNQVDDGMVELQLPFEKTILAGILGMKPESLSRAFSRLKTQGVSSEYRSIRIADMSALREFARAA